MPYAKLVQQMKLKSIILNWRWKDSLWNGTILSGKVMVTVFWECEE
jgi:hypothetical protein